MIDPPAPPAEENNGIEPDEESGAGYGNHAPDVADEPSDTDEDSN